MGKIELDHTGSGSGITLSSDGTDLLLNGTAVGGGGGGAALELYAENPVTPTAPVATGNNAVAIGSESVSAGLKSVALGESRASGTESFAAVISNNTASFGAIGVNSVAIGNSAKATNTGSVAIGSTSTASELYSLALGVNATSSGISSVAISEGVSSGLISVAIGECVSSGSRSVALGRGYASGADSFAAAIANNASSYGATGANSVAIGQLSKASNTKATAIGGEGVQATGFASLAFGDGSRSTGTGATSLGFDAEATANYGLAIGGGTRASAIESVAIGRSANASGRNSFALGYLPLALQDGKYCYASGRFSSASDAQTGTFVLRSDTTDATSEALTTNNAAAGTTNQVILPNNSAYAFHGTIVARQQASAGTACAAWKVEGLIRREGSAGTTVLVNSATTVLDNTPAWGMALSADTTNGGLKIEVTGAAATNIRWVATINTSEVTY